MNLVNKQNRANLATRAKQLATGVAVGMLSFAASASTTSSGGFDSTAIQTKITDNTATGVLLVGLFILGVWSLRSMGLLGGRK